MSKRLANDDISAIARSGVLQIVCRWLWRAIMWHWVEDPVRFAVVIARLARHTKCFIMTLDNNTRSYISYTSFALFTSLEVVIA